MLGGGGRIRRARGGVIQRWGRRAAAGEGGRGYVLPGCLHRGSDHGVFVFGGGQSRAGHQASAPVSTERRLRAGRASDSSALASAST
jgi:hypothetical protein